jgi:hypothetical protein
MVRNDFASHDRKCRSICGRMRVSTHYLKRAKRFPGRADAHDGRDAREKGDLKLERILDERLVPYRAGKESQGSAWKHPWQEPGRELKMVRSGDAVARDRCAHPVQDGGRGILRVHGAMADPPRFHHCRPPRPRPMWWSSGAMPDTSRTRGTTRPGQGRQGPSRELLRHGGQLSGSFAFACGAGCNTRRWQVWWMFGARRVFAAARRQSPALCSAANAFTSWTGWTVPPGQGPRLAGGACASAGAYSGACQAFMDAFRRTRAVGAIRRPDIFLSPFLRALCPSWPILTPPRSPP